MYVSLFTCISCTGCSVSNTCYFARMGDQTYGSFVRARILAFLVVSRYSRSCRTSPFTWTTLVPRLSQANLSQVSQVYLPAYPAGINSIRQRRNLLFGRDGRFHFGISGARCSPVFWILAHFPRDRALVLFLNTYFSRHMTTLFVYLPGYRVLWFHLPRFFARFSRTDCECVRELRSPYLCGLLFSRRL